MRSLAMKFAAILLAAVMLLAGIVSAVAMVLLSETDMNGRTPEEVWEEELSSTAYHAAYAEAERFATYTFSAADSDAIAYMDGWKFAILTYELPAGVGMQCYEVYLDGKLVASGGTDEVPQGSLLLHYQHTVEPRYTVLIPATATAPENSILWDAGYYNNIHYKCYDMEDLTFQVNISLYQAPDSAAWTLVNLVFSVWKILPLILAGSLLLFAVCMVYLCWVAGRKRGSDEIRPAALNALPLDLSGVAVAVLGFCGVRLGAYLIEVITLREFSWLILWLIGLLALLVCLMLIGYIFAIAAQVKAKNHYWWRRSAMGFVAIRVWRLLKWCLRSAGAVARMIPAMWQWLLTAALMVIVPVVMLVLGFALGGFREQFAELLFLGSLAMDVALVFYGGWCFGTILKGARRMAKGDLQEKIDTKNMVGSFRDCAEQLNALSDAALLAAREQLKSERMKTELITNVSHDIKTPLTSIINYVDLLEKPHTEEDGKQYLDVLSRQSARLKKLIEDLMEMSKASTGNVVAEISQVDAAEAVQQALGEFADKLAAKNITPVFCRPEEPVLMQADGRLAWRVMSNLLGNAVKYAMPGTRLYVDVAQAGGKVLISFKNISAEPLNISAEELMERFVRGDASRNTEGSGLGLNIAKSLMEVQRGTLQLLVDGDLFKVTLFFPCS